jgi:hypothetical protein
LPESERGRAGGKTVLTGALLSRVRREGTIGTEALNANSVVLIVDRVAKRAGWRGSFRVTAAGSAPPRISTLPDSRRCGSRAPAVGRRRRWWHVIRRAAPPARGPWRSWPAASGQRPTPAGELAIQGTTDVGLNLVRV